ncbi:hypothetical protein R3P38DRAFT_3263511 [Favolaschia claudopus]|uniref:Uncharacterized protein n=1 Tax=Favolaschia claudopus TaxID=2862362 RepID=A0AAW0C8Q6_9AGAR
MASKGGVPENHDVRRRVFRGRRSGGTFSRLLLSFSPSFSPHLLVPQGDASRTALLHTGFSGGLLRWSGLARDSCRREHHHHLREFQPASTSVECGEFGLVSTSVERVISRATRVAVSIVALANSSQPRHRSSAVNPGSFRHRSSESSCPASTSVECGEFGLVSTSVERVISRATRVAPASPPVVERGGSQLVSTSVERVIACDSVALKPSVASTLYARRISAVVGASTPVTDAAASLRFTHLVFIVNIYDTRSSGLRSSRTQRTPYPHRFRFFPYGTPSSSLDPPALVRANTLVSAPRRIPQDTIPNAGGASLLYEFIFSSSLPFPWADRGDAAGLTKIALSETAGIAERRRAWRIFNFSNATLLRTLGVVPQVPRADIASSSLALHRRTPTQCFIARSQSGEGRASQPVGIAIDSSSALRTVSTHSTVDCGFPSVHPHLRLLCATQHPIVMLIEQ